MMRKPSDIFIINVVLKYVEITAKMMSINFQHGFKEIKHLISGGIFIHPSMCVHYTYFVYGKVCF